MAMITNFNQAAKDQQQIINDMRAAARTQELTFRDCPCQTQDVGPDPGLITMLRRGDLWKSALGGRELEPNREFSDYKQAFGGAYIQNFASPNAKNLLSAASQCIRESGAEGSQELANLLQAAQNEPAKMDEQSVKKLQKFLVAQGLDVGPSGCDGKLGPQTHKALMGLMRRGKESSACTSKPTPAAAPANPNWAMQRLAMMQEFQERNQSMMQTLARA